MSSRLGDELGEALDDQRLRRDRVAGDLLRPREDGGDRRGLVAGENGASARELGAHAGTSSIAIALRTGQTSSQIPQPLQ